MDRDFIAAFAMSLSKESKSADDVEFLKVSKTKCLELIYTFIQFRGDPFYVDLFQGYCLNERLMTFFTIKKWDEDDTILLKCLHPRLRDLVSFKQRKDVAKIIRMMYFQEFITANKTYDLHKILYLFFKVFDMEFRPPTEEAPKKIRIH